MEERILSTSKGVEGFNISAKTERACGEKLLKILPKDWKVRFQWLQIAMYDVAYEIKKKEKIVEIYYNQNLAYWWNDLMAEIKEKLKRLGIKKN
jgi:hypothetical protein